MLLGSDPISTSNIFQKKMHGHKDKLRKWLGNFGHYKHEWVNPFTLRATKTGLAILKIFRLQKYFLENT